MDASSFNTLHETIEKANAPTEEIVGILAEALALRDRNVDAASLRKALAGDFDSALAGVGQIFGGWAVTLDGYADPRSQSLWKCTFRESRGPHDDQIVGIGTAKSRHLALLAAIAHIEAMRAAGYR